MGRVSAIVSAYYASEFIHSRMNNLLEQEPTPEVVVVAQEDSEEDKVATREGVKVIRTTGVPTLYAAWNMAIRQATGDYITNANSDDLLYPGSLRILAETLDAFPHIALCYSDSDVTKEYGGDPVNRMCWVQGGIREIKEGCFIGSMPMWRASLHQKYGFFDDQMKSAGDYEFWLRIMMAGEKVHHVPRALGAYLVRKQSIYHSKPLLSIWEVARSKSRYIKE